MGLFSFSKMGFELIEEAAEPGEQALRVSRLERLRVELGEPPGQAGLGFGGWCSEWIQRGEEGARGETDDLADLQQLSDLELDLTGEEPREVAGAHGESPLDLAMRDTAETDRRPQGGGDSADLLLRIEVFGWHERRLSIGVENSRTPAGGPNQRAGDPALFHRGEQGVRLDTAVAEDEQPAVVSEEIGGHLEKRQIGEPGDVLQDRLQVVARWAGAGDLEHDAPGP